MVRKIFFFLIPFIFVCCASDPAPVETPAAELAPFLPRPEPVETERLKISIEYLKPTTASISVSYSAENWAFIYGVELKNGAGDTVRYTFKNPRRSVRNDASIFENCVIILQDIVDDYSNFTAATKLRNFLAVGDVTARPLADNKIFSFSAVEITQ